MSTRLLAKGACARTKNSTWMTPLHCALGGAVEALSQLVTEQGTETPIGSGVDTATVPVPKGEYLRRRQVVMLVLDKKP